MENTMKINEFWKLEPFCKYLHNESSNLYEIWNLTSQYSTELPKTASWTSLYTHARNKHECGHSHFFACTNIYVLCVWFCAWMFMDFLLVVHYYSMKLSYKFHKDASIFSIFSQLRASKPFKDGWFYAIF